MTGNVYLRRIVSLCSYLAMSYKEQFNQMEGFVRWNLPEELGLEWIDAEYIIFQAPELSNVLTEEQKNILYKIYNNFLSAFDKKTDSEVWTHEAMQTHPFWQKQRTLARQFLELNATAQQ